MTEVLFDFSEVTDPKNPEASGDSAPDILALFAELNETLFESKLPSDHRVFWCERLRVTAGKWEYRTHNGKVDAHIRLSYRLFQKNGWNIAEIRNTLIHEMAHAYLYQLYRFTGHGRSFQNLMHRLVGYRRDHTYHTYDVRGLRNKRRTRVEVYCTGCKCVIGYRKKMPNKRSIAFYTHRVCHSKTTYRTVPLADADTIFDLSSN